MTKPRILVITSTIRPDRMGRTVADWYIAEARHQAPDVDFELLDVADQDLPLFQEPVDPLTASQNDQFTDQQQALADTLAAADGYVIVTAEYNHGVPAPLKNLIDYTVPAAWQHKVVAYVGYGVRGAFWPISHLMSTMSYLGVMSTIGSINIRSIWDAFDDEGRLKPDYALGSVKQQLPELLWWTRALKDAREKESQS